ncbi:hypothetical protein EDD22DRAFT_204995 [Suillus occidentalis]|nr:hypothetical protein EDD22DRAFT_204995 [Suillus occidentalis]
MLLSFICRDLQQVPVVSYLSLAKTGQLEPYRNAPEMPVRTYTFKVELIGSRNPVISRTFSVPASWTFQRLHAAIQYAFGWQNCHLHNFTFEPARRPPTREERRFISMDYREKLVVIHMGTPEDEDDDGPHRHARGLARRTSN